MIVANKNQSNPGTVGSIFKTVGGGTPSTKVPDYWKGKIPWATSADLGDDFLINARKGVSLEAITSSATNLVPAGSVVVATRVGLGKVGIASTDLCFSQDCQALLFDSKKLDPMFVAHQLKLRVQNFKYISRGTTIAGVTKKQLLDVPFDVPSLNEQRAIVAEIEKQLTRLDAGVASLKRLQANLKRYRASVLKAACEGKLVAQKDNWSPKPISSAIRVVEQGWSPKCENEPSGKREDWGVIKTTAIQGMRFLEAENKRLPSKLKPKAHLELHEGDLLITRAGPRSRVGISCLVRSVRPRLILCDKAYRIRCNSKALPEYLELVLNAPHVMDKLDQLKTGISDSGVNLTQKRFGELLVPLPSVEAQQRVLEEVASRLSFVERTAIVLETTAHRAIGLRQAILHSALNSSRSSHQ